MEILFSFLIMALWLGMVLLSRIITTTVHELGHAIPALLFTDKEVVVHVGSYGNTEDSFLVSLGRLKVYFKFNLVQLNMGLCMHQNIPNIPKTMMITLGGPFSSLIFALILVLVIANNNFSDGLITLIALFALSAVWDFIINLIPTPQPILLSGGRVCYNDGQQFLALLQEMRYPAPYFKGLEYQYDKKHILAIGAFEEALQTEQVYSGIYQALAESHVALKDYEMALETYERLHDKFGLLGTDYARVGHIYIEKKEFQEAVRAYNFALHLDYKNYKLLFQRAYAYQEMAEHHAAIQDFDSAIYYHPVYADAYSHRGLSRIRLGDLEGAFRDLEQAKALSPDEPQVYLHLGFYYQKAHNYPKALENFQQAKKMGIEHYGLEYYINEVSE